MSRPSSALQSLAAKFEFFDVLILIYLAVFVREYFWIIPSNRLAWFLTTIVSLAIAAIYLVSKEKPLEKQPIAFWLIVGLPLLFMYILRVGYPDLSFDVLNYHVFHSERALRGLLYIPGDFAPANFPFFSNPAPDMITGVFRWSLGFRLGTIINYLALLWTGSILLKFLRQDIRSPLWLSFAVLLILFSEQFLSEINNYMVDLLALPLLLQAIYLVARDNATAISRKQLIFISLLLGASIALKLTNLVFAGLIGVVALFKLVSKKPRRLREMLISAGAMAVALVLPILPHAVYLYRTTNNPVFPLYNKVFQSPFWTNENVFDGRFGPGGIWQSLIWPFEILFRQDRLSELNVYSGRMPLGLCAILLLLVLVRGQRVTILALVTIVGAFLWSLGTGNIRYGLFLDVLGGLALVLLASYLSRSSSKSQIVRRAPVAVVWAVLLLQSVLAGVYTWEKEWGGRSVGFLEAREYWKELGQLARDRSLSRYLRPEETQLFDGVEAWVESGYKTSAVTAMLRPDLPHLNVFTEAYLATPASLRQFRNAVQLLDGRKMLSIIFEEDLPTALVKLQKRGFMPVKTSRFPLRFFSSSRLLSLVVIEVARDPSGPLTPSIFHAEIKVLKGPPATMKAGEEATVRVRVKNKSRGVWPANKSANGAQQVALGNKWLDELGRIVVNDDARTPLPADLTPESDLELDLHIRAPASPGKYILRLDLLQEQVSWFYDQGSLPVELDVTVIE